MGQNLAEFSDNDVARALAFIRGRKLGGWTPFCRDGTTAAQVAYEMGFVTDKVAKRSGRVKPDTAKAARLLAHLVASGDVVFVGKDRTLQAGSSYIKIWRAAQ